MAKIVSTKTYPTMIRSHQMNEKMGVMLNNHQCHDQANVKKIQTIQQWVYPSLDGVGISTSRLGEEEEETVESNGREIRQAGMKKCVAAHERHSWGNCCML